MTSNDDNDDKRISFNVASSPKTARTCNKLTITVKSRSSQGNEMFLVMIQNSCKIWQTVRFSVLRKTCSDGDDRTDSGKLFQTDAAVAGKVRSPMVEGTVRGATSADVEESACSCQRALRCDTCCRSVDR